MTITTEPILDVANSFNKGVGAFVGYEFNTDGTGCTTEEDVEPNEVAKSADSKSDEVIGEGITRNLRWNTGTRWVVFLTAV